MNWLVPCNPEKYDIDSAFRSSPFVYWRQRVSFEVGDTVYIYLSKGVSGIRYKAFVTETDIDSRTIDDPFWNDPEEAYKVPIKAEMKLLKEYNTDALSYKQLTEHGLSSTIQGPIKVTGQLLSYIKSIDQREQ